MEGFNEDRIYPLTPDLVRARTLAHGRHGTAVLYACDVPPCEQLAEVVKKDLNAIGLRVEVRAISLRALYAGLVNRQASFDLALFSWIADYPDPYAFLNFLLEGGTVLPTFNDPAYKRKLDATAELSGPHRYLTYARLDADLERNGAPWAAYGTGVNRDFFSARIGCKINQPGYGIDLAALCVRT